MESDYEIDEDIQLIEEIDDEEVHIDQLTSPVRCSSAKGRSEEDQLDDTETGANDTVDLENQNDPKNLNDPEDSIVDEEEKGVADILDEVPQEKDKEGNEIKIHEEKSEQLQAVDKDNLDNDKGMKGKKTKVHVENDKEDSKDKEKEDENKGKSGKKKGRCRKKKDGDEAADDEGIDVADGKTKKRRRRRKNSADDETGTVDEIEDDVFDEDVEEEEDETEMTEDEKEDMYEAIRNGKYVLFQDLLDKKNSDINMTWYSENLLMVALRANQIIMAEFLIDNGIDVNYTTTLLELHKNKTKKRFLRYKMSCRQLAYDLGHLDIVEQIDVKNNNLHKYYKPTPRIPRMRRPPAPPLPWEIEEEEEDIFSDEEEMFGDTQQETYTSRSAMNPTSSARTKNESELLETDQYYSTEIQEDVPDEGYGTISPVSPVPSPVKSLRGLVEQRPGLLRRGTRSSLTRENFNSAKYRTQYPKSADYIHSMRRKTSPIRDTSNTQPRRKSEFSEKESRVSADFASFHSDTPSRVHASPPHFIPSGFEIKRKTLRPRPFSSPASPLAQVTKILNQSKLLSNKYTEPGLPYIKSDGRTATAKVVTPWCHGNSTGMYEQLSNTKIFNAVMQKSVTVNGQLYSRRNWSAKR